MASCWQAVKLCLFFFYSHLWLDLQNDTILISLLCLFLHFWLTGWEWGRNSVLWISKDPLPFWPQREETFPSHSISHKPPNGLLSDLAWLPGGDWTQSCRKAIWHQSCWDGSTRFPGALQREGHSSLLCFPGVCVFESVFTVSLVLL